MQAKKLIVTASIYNHEAPEDAEESTYTFEVYELENGLIATSGLGTNDCFYEDREWIQSPSLDSICGVTETDSVRDWDLEDLKKTIRDSLYEYGGIPAKALAMLG